MIVAVMKGECCVIRLHLMAALQMMTKSRVNVTCSRPMVASNPAEPSDDALVGVILNPLLLL